MIPTSPPPENTPIAYLNGRWVPLEQAALPVWDAGVVLGAAVAEQVRTFAQQPFRLEEHLRRLQHSLELVGLDSGLSLDQWQDICHQVVRHNARFLAPGEELGLVLFVTAGPYPTLFPGEAPPLGRQPTVCAHTYVLPLRRWGQLALRGVSLRIAPVRQVPPECWSPQIKARSRLHFFLAAQWAAAQEPGAQALLLTTDGQVAECPTANVVMLQSGRLLAPPEEVVLPGISLRVLDQLARGLGIPLEQRPLRPEELAQAEELYVTSTPYCMLPVVRVDGRAVGPGTPGPMYRRLMQAWSELVGVDVLGQMLREESSGR